MRTLIGFVVVVTFLCSKPLVAQAHPSSPNPADGPTKETILYEAEDGFQSNWSANDRWSGQRLRVFFNELEWLRASSALPRGLQTEDNSPIWDVLSQRDRGVFFAYLGTAPTGGYGIRIARIWMPGAASSSRQTEKEPLVLVEIRRRKPEPGDFVIQAFTHPYDVATVRMDQLPEPPYRIVFVDEKGDGLQAYRVERRSEFIVSRPAPVPSVLPSPPSDIPDGSDGDVPPDHTSD